MFIRNDEISPKYINVDHIIRFEAVPYTDGGLQRFRVQAVTYLSGSSDGPTYDLKSGFTVYEEADEFLARVMQAVGFIDTTVLLDD